VKKERGKTDGIRTGMERRSPVLPRIRGTFSHTTSSKVHFPEWAREGGHWDSNSVLEGNIGINRIYLGKIMSLVLRLGDSNGRNSEGLKRKSVLT